MGIQFCWSRGLPTLGTLPEQVSCNVEWSKCGRTAVEWESNGGLGGGMRSTECHSIIEQV